MNKITVTMPMSDYQNDQELIERLHSESIERFIGVDYVSLESEDYTVVVDAEKIKEYINKKYRNRKEITFRAVEPSSFTNKG